MLSQPVIRDASFSSYPNGLDNRFDMTVFWAYRDYFFEIDIRNKRSVAIPNAGYVEDK